MSNDAQNAVLARILKLLAKVLTLVVLDGKRSPYKFAEFLQYFNESADPKIPLSFPNILPGDLLFCHHGGDWASLKISRVRGIENLDFKALNIQSEADLQIFAEALAFAAGLGVRSTIGDVGAVYTFEIVCK